MQHAAAKTYAAIIDQFRNKPTPALMAAALTLADLPVSDVTTKALDLSLFILAERIEMAEFDALIKKIEEM